MSPKVKLIVAGVLLTGALLWLFMQWRANTPRIGEGKAMVLSCPACGEKAAMNLDEALGKGADFSGEFGWGLPCPKCRQRATLTPATKPATP